MCGIQNYAGTCSGYYLRRAESSSGGVLHHTSCCVRHLVLCLLLQSAESPARAEAAQNGKPAQVLDNPPEESHFLPQSAKGASAELDSWGGRGRAGAKLPGRQKRRGTQKRQFRLDIPVLVLRVHTQPSSDLTGRVF